MEKALKAPKMTPSVRGGEKKTRDDFDRAGYQRNLFFVTALNMSWQLAIAVLVPVAGGYKLDQHFGTKPVLTLCGFIVAMAATSVVLWRQLQHVAPKITQEDIDAAKKLRDKENDN
jgi:F0F1-type ATP synthase assembly protein I